MRATPRRLSFLGLALVAAVALPVRPAAALSIVTDWRTPSAGATVSGTVIVDLDAAFELSDVYRVRRWRVRLVDGTDTTLMCTKTLWPSQKKATVSFTWDSRHQPSGDCADGVAGVQPHHLDNGSYTLELTVWEHVTNGDGNAGTATRAVVLNNAPTAPGSVDAEWNPAAQSVVLDWQASPEDDVTGYRLQQCHTPVLSDPCGGAWTQVATPGPGTTSVSVAVEDPGAYRYRVQARRPHGSGDGETTSPWSHADEHIFLEPAGDGCSGDDCTTTTLGGSDSGEGGKDSGSRSDGGGDGSTPGIEVEGGSGGDGGGSESVAAGPQGLERRRSLPPRLIRRTDVEDAYAEKLPYGKALPGDDGPLDLVTDGGAGMALVPVAGGALAIVFAFQMRYLTRRAEMSPLDP